ncbi:MAG: cytochrome c, partial [Aureliella sp.]
MTDPNKLDRHEQRRGTEPDVEELHEIVYREKTEPREGRQPVPTEMIVAAFALLLFGGWYLGNYSADFAIDSYEGPAAFVGSSGDKSKTPTVIDPKLMGKRVFNYCAACHQASGQGVAGQYPPLDGNPVVADRADNLARIVLHGLSWLLLMLTTLVVPRTWQDKETCSRQTGLWHRFKHGSAANRAALRARMLAQNPFQWLTGRDPVKPLLVWLALGLGGLIWLMGILTTSRDWLHEGAYFFTAYLAHTVLKVWVTF